MEPDAISVDALNSLAEKIQSLQLTGDEQSVLDLLLTRAAAVDQDVDVLGFSLPLKQMVRVNQFSKPFALGLGLGPLQLSSDDQFP